MKQIELKNIDKTYFIGDMQVPVLKKINLEIAQGEYVALTGASGSGKSTLMNILGCLDRPTSGEYFFEGKEYGSASNDERAMLRNRKIGFVFQSFNLLPRTSALDNVIMPLTYTNSSLFGKEARKRGEEMLERVGLAGRMHHHPNQLSGGQQQRVAIARALVGNPTILLADEPTGALDQKTGKQVMQLFHELNEEGRTIIMITHDMNIAAFAKRIVRIIDGELLEGGDTGHD